MKKYVIAILLLSGLQPLMANPVTKSDIDEQRLKNLVLGHQEVMAEKTERLEKRIKQLQIELEAAQDEGAQYWFKRTAQVCGAATAIGIVAVVTAESKLGKKVFGSEPLGTVILGGSLIYGAGACTALSGTIYSLVNGDIDELEVLVEAAEVELKNIERLENLQRREGL